MYSSSVYVVVVYIPEQINLFCEEFTGQIFSVVILSTTYYSQFFDDCFLTITSFLYFQNSIFLAVKFGRNSNIKSIKMYSVLRSDINTENSLESLIALSFPSKQISNFSVRIKPVESVNTEIYFQGILLEKFDENRGESVKSKTSSRYKISNASNGASNSPKKDFKINEKKDSFSADISPNENSQKNEFLENKSKVEGKKDEKGGEILYCIVLYCIVLYCIVLYCIVLYCIVLYCIVLYCIYCIVLYCVVLYCIVLYCIALCCIILCCIVLYCIVLYCIMLYSIVLYCIVQYCIILYCLILYYIVLYSIALYCIVLYCILFSRRLKQMCIKFNYIILTFNKRYI